MSGLSWFKQYVGTHTQRELARGERALAKIDKLGRGLGDETDERLAARAATLRQRARDGAALDDLLVETFALTREVAQRQIGLRPFDVQLMGGVALYRGNIIEMKTGEGKTLVAVAPVILQALAGAGVHVITVNDYLAARDAAWMGPVYRFFGLSVGVVTEELDADTDRAARRAAYAADITYVTNHELVFDYLRDNLAEGPAEQVLRPLASALVDELDLLLLDEAATPLIISGETDEDTALCARAAELVARLRPGKHFKVDHRSKQAAIQEEGWALLEKSLGVENLAAPEQLPWQHVLHQALLAHAVYERDIDYVLQEGEVRLIDEHTGRVSPDKRFSDGLHQALEAKEGLAVQAEDRTLAKVSYQLFFRLYPQLAGMTGTAYSAREELQRTYGLRVVVLPTNQPLRRRDLPNVVFRSGAEKLEAVAEAVAEAQRDAQPVLVGTTSVKESERLSALFTARAIPHTVLNAKNHQTEAEAIAQAGRPGAVTVSTNMAGRGVDILLGGRPPEGDAEQRAQHERDRAQVVAAGGLLVLGTGLHESRRIDDQLRGRAGRQGDPGGSRFFLSLDDPIYRRFGERDTGLQILDELRKRLRDHPRGEPVQEGRVLRTLQDLQHKVEVEAEGQRTEVLRYDLIVDQQRRAIYGWRQRVLSEEHAETLELLHALGQGLLERWAARLMGLAEDEQDAELAELEAQLAALDGDAEADESLDDDVRRRVSADELDAGKKDGPDREAFAGQVEALLERTFEAQGRPEELLARAKEELENRLRSLQAVVGEKVLAVAVGAIFLAHVDRLWTDHLGELERIEDEVDLRSYAELDPLLEFRREAHRAYQAMLTELREAVLVDALTLGEDDEDDDDYDDDDGVDDLYDDGDDPTIRDESPKARGL